MLFLLVLLCQDLMAQRDSVFYFDSYFRRRKDPLIVSYKGVLRKYNGKKYEVDLYTLDGLKIAFAEYNSRRLRKRNGVFVRFNGEERIVISANYKNGLLHGMLLRFYDNGLLADSGTLRYGSNIGTWKQWYPDGQIKEIQVFSKYSNYRFGVRDKEYMSWYPNGQVKDSGYYKSGNRTGIWLEYLEGGDIRSVGEYKRDWKRGLWKYYDSKGRLLYMRKFSRFNYDDVGKLVQINR